jgi:hypothetical protein
MSRFGVKNGWDSGKACQAPFDQANRLPFRPPRL